MMLWQYTNTVLYVLREGVKKPKSYGPVRNVLSPPPAPPPRTEKKTFFATFHISKNLNVLKSGPQTLMIVFYPYDCILGSNSCIILSNELLNTAPPPSPRRTYRKKI